MSKILLAENGAIAMTLAGALLDDPCNEVEAVTDGRSLLDRLTFAPKDYDIIVLSDNLGEISMNECILFLRRIRSKIPIIAMAEHIDSAYLDQLAHFGLCSGQILQKPVDPQTLSAYVEKILAAERNG